MTIKSDGSFSLFLLFFFLTIYISLLKEKGRILEQW